MENLEFLSYFNEHWKNKLYDVKEREEKIKILNNKITFILGVRRVGKSSLLKLKINELIKNGKNPFEILYLDFFNILLFDYLDGKKFVNLIENYLKINNIKEENLYLFLDEIQEVKEWQRVLEYFRTKGIKVICSGSNSKLLEKEVRSLLVGRTIIKELFPLKFKEFLMWKDVDIKEKNIITIKKIKDLISDYLISAMPEYVLLKDKEVTISLFHDIIVKDVFSRYNIKEKNKFKELAFYLLNNITNYITSNSLRKKLNLDIKTIQEYLTYLNESYLFYFLNNYSTKAHEQINSPKKVYIVDNGFYYFIKTKTTRDYGKLMENLVFINLRRKYKENEELFYFKTKNNYEVDFLIKEKNQIKELINVTYANSYEEINQREIRALLHAKEELKLNNKVPLTIITWDYEDEKEISWFGKKGRIKFIPLWKWLLKV